MLPNVPYVSQWSDPNWNKDILSGVDPCNDPTWMSTGFSNKDKYRFWSWRLCGLACFRSVLLHIRGDAPTVSDLLDKALERKAFELREDGSVHGLIYRPFCEWFNEEYSIQAVVLENLSLEAMFQSQSSEGFYIVSVSPEIRNPETINPRKGGHLVLITSYSDADTVTFHNPSGIMPHHENVVMKQTMFEKFFARRGIFIPL